MNLDGPLAMAVLKRAITYEVDEAWHTTRDVVHLVERSISKLNAIGRSAGHLKPVRDVA